MALPLSKIASIEHLLTAPRSPTTTGKIERFHRSLRAEFLSAHTPFTNLKTAQHLAALVKVARRSGIGFHQNVLVIVADLVAEMTQHGAVRLTEVDPKRLTVGVQRLDQIDRDYPAGVPDYHAFTAAVTGQQIKRKPSVFPPERVDRQADVNELTNQPPQGDPGGYQLFHCDGVVGVGLAADQGIRQTSPPLTAQFLLLRHQPVAAEAGRPCARNPDLAVDNRGARRGRDHSAARDMKSKFCQAIRAAPRLEWDEATADGAGERAHGFHRGSPRGPAASFPPVSRRTRRMAQRHWSKLHPADIPEERFGAKRQVGLVKSVGCGTPSDLGIELSCVAVLRS